MTQRIIFGQDAGLNIDSKELLAEYRTLLLNLEKSNVPFVVIGAIAVAMTWGTRLTRDLDGICSDLSAIVDVLYESGFLVTANPVSTEPGAWVAFDAAQVAKEALLVRDPSSFKCFHGKSGAEIDVWIKSPDASRISIQQILDNAVPATLMGISFKRACAEDLLELKKIALAANPSRMPKDGGDIVHLEDYISRKPERKR